MKYLNTFFKPTIFFCVIFLFQSCKYFGDGKREQGRNIVCVVDFSDSRNVNERLEFYMTVIKNNVIPKLDMKDRISVIPIDKASLTNSSDILLEDLSSHDFVPEMASPMEEDKITLDNLNNFKTELIGKFETSFHNAIQNRNSTNLGTDIFGALEIVKGKFASTNNNILIVFSDMMNYTNTLKMEPQNNEFNESTLNASLNKVPLIQLNNTIALILTGNQSSIVTQEHFTLVKTFWERYFEKSEVELFDYNSASVAKLNELMLSSGKK